MERCHKGNAARSGAMSKRWQQHKKDRADGGELVFSVSTQVHNS